MTWISFQIINSKYFTTNFYFYFLLINKCRNIFISKNHFFYKKNTINGFPQKQNPINTLPWENPCKLFFLKKIHFQQVHYGVNAVEFSEWKE